MDWFEKHRLQLLFVAAYLAMLAWHGWQGRRKTRDLADFLVGGRRLGGVVIGLSFYATFVSSVTFVGHAGRSYIFGPVWWVICVVVFTTMVLVAWFVVAPPFTRMARRYGSLTIPDFLGYHYRSTPLRRLAALVVIVASLAYMVAVYEGGVRLLVQLLELDSTTVTLIIFAVVTTYTLAGGFHSVVATDAVQGLILFAGAMLLPVAMIVRAGGLGPLLDAVQQNAPTAMSWQPEPGISGGASVFYLVGLALGVGMKFVVEPRQLSRFYGLRSDRQLRRGRWVAPSLLFLTYLGMLPVGFLAHAWLNPADLGGGTGRALSDNVVPTLLGSDIDLLGPVAGAFFLTALVAAAMSSIDSVLLVAASSVDHDLLAPDRDRTEAVRRTRWWVLLLSSAAAGGSLVLDEGITEMSALSGALYAGCFVPTLILGLFWRRATCPGAMAGLVVGFGATAWWFVGRRLHLVGTFEAVHEVYVGTVLATAAAVIVALAGRSTRGDQSTTVR